MGSDRHPAAGRKDVAEAESRRRRLMAEIVEEARLCGPATGRPRLRDEVLQALQDVPREAFVRADDREFAYLNEPLPIGHGQTISQPFIVALMTELADCRPGHTVLEVGTGSGYQAAVLARLVQHVYSVEVVPELAAGAAEALRRLGVGNVSVRAGDGRLGWPEHAPYDAILVTAASESLPVALGQQLRPGGRLVYPRGEAWGVQQLMLVSRSEDGVLTEQPVLDVRFVPLVGQA
jgi:protein-L-isoaspartate(D-aspartate) O-methyltransferase